MRTKKIFVELVADRATVAVVERGRIALTESLSFGVKNDPNEWVQSLRDICSELKSFVQQHKLDNYATVVVYQSPTAAVNLTSVPIASGANASEVASLSCLDALPYTSLVAVVQAEVIGRDRGGENKQLHVLVAAERDDVATAIVDMVTDAGLKFQAATPIDALICRRLANAALRNSGDPEGTLYVGEHCSYFMVGGNGRLEFERRLSFDIHAMESTLRRPIRMAGDGDTKLIELNIDEARTIAHRFGVPDWKVVVDESRGITGAQVIPLLQPLLQRLIVELRQSLRFGVSDKQRGSVPINFCGPGVCIPNLAETISKELNVEIVPDESWREFDFDDATCSISEFNNATRSASAISKFNLQPNELANHRRTQKMKTWLWTGAAAALAIIVVDYVQYGARLNDARAQADMLSIGAVDIEALRATSERLKGTIAALTDLDQQIINETASSISFRAMFNELSRATPETVRLTTFSFSEADGQIVGRLNGYVFDTDGEGGQVALQSFISALKNSPLMADASLGDVQLGSIGGQEGRRFDAKIIVVAAPWPLVQEHLATASHDDEQIGGGP